MSQNIKLAVPFFLVLDMDASLRFYVDGLGFQMTNKWVPRDKIEWCWLQRDGVAIMLQEPRQQKEGPAGQKGLRGSYLYAMRRRPGVIP